MQYCSMHTLLRDNILLMHASGYLSSLAVTTGQALAQCPDAWVKLTSAHTAIKCPVLHWHQLSDLYCHAEILKAQAVCQPIDPLADIALVEIQLGEDSSMFTPIKPPSSEDPAPHEAPVAAPPPAKASAKGAAAAAAAKVPAKGVAAAVDQGPPLGGPELGRALELLGAQVHKYHAWREKATVHGLLAAAVTEDDLAAYRSLLTDIPQVCA